MTGQEKMSAGVGIVITPIPNFTHKYTFYINKLCILILSLILVALSLYALLLFGVAGQVNDVLHTPKQLTVGRESLKTTPVSPSTP